MFSLFFVASLVLPTVLGGGCCFPEKWSGLSYIAGHPERSDVLVDFSQNKGIVRPMQGDVEFMLNDLNAKMSYTKFTDGSCVAEPLDRPYARCMPSTTQYAGTVTLADSLVHAYTVPTGEDSSLYFVVTPDCHPVMSIETIQGETTTQFFTNVTASVSDVSDLNQDISECKMEMEE